MTAAGSTHNSIWQTRIAPALAAPLSVLIVVPLLVVGTGLVIAFTAGGTMRGALDGLARARFVDHAVRAREVCEEAFQQAEVLLPLLQQVVRRADGALEFDTFVRATRDLLPGRPGAAYLGIGQANGDFYGCFYRQGELFATERRYAPEATVLRDYRLAGREPELVRSDPNNAYDPRTRIWYRQALAQGHRIWTPPYLWYDSGLLGVGCAEPVFDADGGVSAVVAVDFNLNSLGAELAELPLVAQQRSLIATYDGALIASTGFRQAEGMGRAGEGEVPQVSDLGDPVVAALSAELQAGANSIEAGLVRRFQHAGEAYLYAAEPISLHPDTRWYALSYGPQSTVVAPALTARQKGLQLTALALFLALLVSLVYARIFLHAQRRVRSAERARLQAERTARQLGSYALVRLLGRGGMGEVWLGRHRLLALPVAVKLIHPDIHLRLGPAEQQRAVERFRREARTLASLRSRHTTRIFDFGLSDDGELFYAMELLEGVDLHQLLRDHGPQPVQRVLQILDQAAISLGEAHRRGLVHRDIKPANLFLCRQDEEYDLVKVLDFGVVRQSRERGERLTLTGSIEGTPAYMAPEQAEDQQEVDGRADCYALACVAFFLLAGRDVFERDTPMGTLLAHVQEPPPSLRACSKRFIPAELDSLIASCLAKDPADRPADMRALRRALAAVPIPPGEEWTSEQAERWWQGIPERQLAAEPVLEEERSLIRHLSE